MTTTADAAEAPPYLPLRDTWRLLRPIHPHLLGTAAMSAVAEAVGIAPYLAAVEIARAVFTAPTAPTAVVWTWVAVGGIGAVVRLILLAWSSHVGHLADAAIPPHLVDRIVHRLGVLALGWFRSGGSGRVKKVMNDDLGSMHDLFAHAVGRIVGAAIGTLVVFGYLLLVDWRLALITLAAPAVAMFVSRTLLRSSSSMTGRVIAAEERLTTAAVEYVDGIAVVKVFGGTQRRALHSFDDAIAEYAAAYRAYMSQHRFSSALSGVLAAELTVLAVVTAAGLWFVQAGAFPVVDLLPFMVMGIRLTKAFGPVVHGAADLRTAQLSAAHIAQLLTLPPLPEPDSPREPDGHRIEFDDVTFRYDDVSPPAVRGVSAVCEPGTLTALVGPSGAGKTTLASLVARFYDVTEGAVRVGGVDVRHIPQDRLLASMSLVFQDVSLVRDTVAENIRLARPETTDEEIRRAAKAAQVHEVIEALPDGYETMLGADRAGLSGGEQQRLTIARAIVSDAPIVLLDEATAALDPDSEAAVQDALSELIAGKTVLVVAHRLHTIVDADQILVLDAGQLVERGTHPELLAARGRYARLWHAQERENER